MNNIQGTTQKRSEISKNKFGYSHDVPLAFVIEITRSVHAREYKYIKKFLEVKL